MERHAGHVTLLTLSGKFNSYFYFSFFGFPQSSHIWKWLKLVLTNTFCAGYVTLNWIEAIIIVIMFFAQFLIWHYRGPLLPRGAVKNKMYALINKMFAVINLKCMLWRENLCSEEKKYAVKRKSMQWRKKYAVKIKCMLW